MKVWSLFYGLLIASETLLLWYLCRFFGHFRFARYNPVVLPLALFAHVGTMLLGVALGLPDWLGEIFYYAVDVVIVLAIFEIKAARGLVLCGLFHAAALAVDMLLMLVLEQGLGLARGVILADGPLLCAEAIVARLILLVLVQVAPRKLYPHQLYVSNRALLLYGAAPLGSSLLVFSLLVYRELLLEMPGLPLVFLLVWWLNVLNVYYFDSRERIRRRLLELQATADLAQELERYEQRISAYALELDRTVHDLKFAEMSEAASELLGRHPIHTGNTVIDAVLDRYENELRDRPVGFAIRGRLPARLPVERGDLRLLLGNMLQNAVEGCIKCGQPPWIRFTAHCEPMGLFIEVANSADARVRASFPHRSSKRGAAAYGHGEPTIERIVRKYGGELLPLVDEAEGSYCLRVILPVKVDIEYGQEEREL